VEVLSFATDDSGHSAWAMVLRCTDLEWLRARLREASYKSHCQNGRCSDEEVRQTSDSDGLAETDEFEPAQIKI
jgi:hypothetical protein